MYCIFSTLRSDFQSDKWELDAEFFSALSKWTLDHPESTLDRVLERIDQAIEGGKNYMELIPDTPFPARGLVKAVAQLIQLSAKISRGQGKVRDFSFKIINWVNRVKESFTKAGNGQFTERTWSNLASMRQSVLTSALEHLRETQEKHIKRILEEQERKRFIDESLCHCTVQDSTYIAQKKRPCDSNTRVENLKEIEDWIDDCTEVSSENFLWLVGPPGCGKSAITASIAYKCKSTGILGAQFFINRNDHNTTNPNCYFPTVARELARRSDSTERHLYDALKGQIHPVATPEEAATLFVDIVGEVASSDPTIPVVILFDGLDETSRDSLEDTAGIFSQLLTSFRKFPNVKILISSHPEDAILKSFKHTPDRRFIELLIRTDDPTCLRDVRTFLTQRLTMIAARHGLSSSGWPDEDDVANLAIQASGLFIWAVTASNYINARLRIQGKEILKTLLNHFSNKAMNEINTLYRTILDFSYPSEIQDPWIFETFRRLMGTIMVLREPMNIRDLSLLLDLREMPHSSRVDIRNFVENIRTILVSDLDDVTEETVPRAHKSFFDFITGNHIPEHFRVDIETSNAELALLCLHHLTLAYSDVYATHCASKNSDLKILSTAVRYSLRFTLSHSPQQGRSAFGVLSDHPEVVESSQLDALLHRSTHMNCAGPMGFSLPSNHAYVRTSLEKNDLLWNTEDGPITSKMTLPISWPLINISSDGSRIFFRYKDRIECIPEDSYDFNTKRSVFHLDQGRHALELSFDGTKVVYATDRNTIFLCDISSNVVASEIPNRHQEETYLCLSQSCSYIALSSFDRVLHIWDINNTRYINQPDSIQHESHVVCVAIAPDDTMLVTCDKRRAYVWEIPACKRSPHSFAFKPGGRRSVAFSPDSQTVLAGSREGYVFLWNPHTGREIGEPWSVRTTIDRDNPVFRVAFRSCGKIALACSNNNVHVWNVSDATSLMVIPHAKVATFSPEGSRLLHIVNCDFTIRNLAPLLLNSRKSTFKPNQNMLSPGGNLLVSVTKDEILCWRLDATVVGRPLKGGGLSVNAVAFSVDESRIAGVAEDGTVYLWDSTSQELLSSLPNCARGASSLLFTLNGDYIVINLGDNQSVVSLIVDDFLAVLNNPEAQKLATIAKSTFFDLDKSPMIFGANAATPNRRLKDVRWYPSRSDSVVWAYVNNYIIRVGKDGNSVVVPVGTPCSVDTDFHPSSSAIESIS
ncbi:hypothetical protein C0993_009010 [Termitomyces sp. T159_Od127]|nr:hypothetical protein C0993_009010 [Termitomyces sp. T159_Od127]